MGAFIIIFVGVAILQMFGVLDSDDHPELTADVGLEGYYIVVTNRDNFTWTDVTLDLNYSAWRSGYTVNIRRMKPGEHHFHFRDFTDQDGQRFNPTTHRAEKIKIDADEGMTIFTAGR